MPLFTYIHNLYNQSISNAQITILERKQTRQFKITSFCHWPTDISYNRQFKSNNSTYINSMMFRDKD